MPTANPTSNNPSLPNASFNAGIPNPGAGNHPSFGTPCLKTVYLSFEKEKTASEVMHELSEANLFVAVNPGCCTTGEKVIELLIPASTPNDLVRSILCRNFSDLVDVNSAVAIFRIGLNATDYKRAKTALKAVSVRVSACERVSDARAYFSIVTNPSVNAETIADCLSHAKLEANCIEPVWNAMLPNTIGIGSGINTNYPLDANPGLANLPSAYNPMYTGSINPFAYINSRFICNSLLPALHQELTIGGPITPALASVGLTNQAFWNAIATCAQACSANPNASPNLLPNANLSWSSPYPMPLASAINGNSRTIQTVYAELCNPASRLANVICQMGIQPAAIAAILAPFSTNNPASSWIPAAIEARELQTAGTC